MHLGPFGCVMKLVAKCAELVQKFVPRSRVKIFRNEGTRSTPLDPKLMFFCSSYYLTRSRVRIFRNEGTLSTPLDPKLMFFCVSYYLTRIRVRIFRNEGTLSTPLDPKLMFWCVSYYLGAFGTVCLRYEPWCKTGRNCAKVRATKSRWNFSQRRQPIHTIGP